MRREILNLTVEREFLQRLLATGRAFDLERGGLYDARSGVVNLWCSPDDKPACWNRSISRGGLSYPREYVGALAWDWLDDDRAELYVEAAPYALIERRRREPLPEPAWQEILAWVREKALGMVRLARLEPRIVGTCCPCCSFVLPGRGAAQRPAGVRHGGPPGPAPSGRDPRRHAALDDRPGRLPHPAGRALRVSGRHGGREALKRRVLAGLLCRC